MIPSSEFKHFYLHAWPGPQDKTIEYLDKVSLFFRVIFGGERVSLVGSVVQPSHPPVIISVVVGAIQIIVFPLFLIGAIALTLKVIIGEIKDYKWRTWEHINAQIEAYQQEAQNSRSSNLPSESPEITQRTSPAPRQSVDLILDRSNEIGTNLLRRSLPRANLDEIERGSDAASREHSESSEDQDSLPEASPDFAGLEEELDRSQSEVALDAALEEVLVESPRGESGSFSPSSGFDESRELQAQRAFTAERESDLTAVQQEHRDHAEMEALREVEEVTRRLREADEQRAREEETRRLREADEQRAREESNRLIEAQSQRIRQAEESREREGQNIDPEAQRLLNQFHAMIALARLRQSIEAGLNRAQDQRSVMFRFAHLRGAQAPRQLGMRAPREAFRRDENTIYIPLALLIAMAGGTRPLQANPNFSGASEQESINKARPLLEKLREFPNNLALMTWYSMVDKFIKGELQDYKQIPIDKVDPIITYLNEHEDKLEDDENSKETEAAVEMLKELFPRRETVADENATLQSASPGSVEARAGS